MVGVRGAGEVRAGAAQGVASEPPLCLDLLLAAQSTKHTRDAHSTKGGRARSQQSAPHYHEMERTAVPTQNMLWQGTAWCEYV